MPTQAIFNVLGVVWALTKELRPLKSQSQIFRLFVPFVRKRLTMVDIYDAIKEAGIVESIKALNRWYGESSLGLEESTVGSVLGFGYHLKQMSFNLELRASLHYAMAELLKEKLKNSGRALHVTHNKDASDCHMETRGMGKPSHHILIEITEKSLMISYGHQLRGRIMTLIGAFDAAAPDFSPLCVMEAISETITKIILHCNGQRRSHHTTCKIRGIMVSLVEEVRPHGIHVDPDSAILNSPEYRALADALAGNL
jgi:hypothetical protein